MCLTNVYLRGNFSAVSFAAKILNELKNDFAEKQ